MAYKPSDVTIARYLTTSAEISLFRSMPSADQVHSVRTMERMVADGVSDQDLLKAALLHDAGKALANPNIIVRVVRVLMEWLWPSVWSRLSAPCGKHHWRYPFHVMAHHAELGAELARESGAAPRVVEIVRGHGSGKNGPTRLLDRYDDLG